MIGSMIGNTLNASIGALLGHEIENATSDLIEKSPVWLIFLVTVILAPIIEELMFRKFMIDRLSRYGDKVAIIVSAVAFGLFHGNFYQFFYAALIGLVLGYMYCESGNVKHTILMHMIINFLGSVAVIPVMNKSEDFMTMSEAFANGEAVDMAAFINAATVVLSYSIIQYALAAIGFVFLILAIRDKKIKIKNCGEYTIPKSDVFETVVLNVGGILFIVFSVLSFFVNIFMG
jgi:membrane protease YdiL (CAAX protease family)